MKALRYIVIIISSLIAIGLFLLWNAGLFDRIELAKKEVSAYIVAGYNFRGSYQQIGPLMGEVDSILKAAGIQSSKGFGIFYNDPNTTPESQLESYVGNVIEGDDRSKLNDIVELGLQVDTIPSGEAWVASIPIRSQFSYMIGPVRAYPVLEEAVSKENDDIALVYEIYDLEKEQIHYSMLIQP